MKRRFAQLSRSTSEPVSTAFGLPEARAKACCWTTGKTNRSPLRLWIKRVAAQRSLCMWARRQWIAPRDWPSTRHAQVQTRFVVCRRFFFCDDDDIAERYRIVAGAADLPLFAYNLPGATGVEIAPGMMAKIRDRVPQLAGLKHSALTFANVRTFAQMDLACFIGNHRLMLPALTLGACGCVDGPLNVLPELWVAIWTAYRAGDLKTAEAAQEKALMTP